MGIPQHDLKGFGGIVRDVRWLLVPAACLLALMVGLGFLLTDVLPSTALGRWDAEVPGRLVEYRQQEGISESKLITTLSETLTIITLTALAAAVCRWKFGRWRESLVVIYAVIGETAIFVATTLFIDRPRPRVPHLDEAPPTSSFPSGHTAAAVCFYGSIAAIILWHSRHRWIRVAAVVVCAAVPLLIAGSRVYRGMHYPTDVLAGALLGAIWLTVVIFYVRTHDAGGRRHAAVDADRRLVSRWQRCAITPSEEPEMSTATRVPETITISGDELSADDAVTTLRRYGRWNLVKNSFIRFRYADGFTNARALALQLCLSFIPLIIAVVGLSSALHHEKFGQVVTQTLTRVLPGSDDGDMVEEAAQRTQRPRRDRRPARVVARSARRDHRADHRDGSDRAGRQPHLRDRTRPARPAEVRSGAADGVDRRPALAARIPRHHRR